MLMYTVFTALLCEFYRHDLLVLDTITSKILKIKIRFSQTSKLWLVCKQHREVHAMDVTQQKTSYNLHVDLIRDML